MARIRTIKPEFWSSPDTAACADPWARLLFVAMWNWADDEGRGTANSKELAGFAFPHDDDITPADIRRMLGEVHRAFGVVFYTAKGRPYYAIPSWNNHQKIDKRSSGKHPAPDAGDPWDPEDGPGSDRAKDNDSRVLIEDSEKPSEVPQSPRRMPGAGTGEQGNRGTGEQKTSAPRGAKPDLLFDRFYAIYPRKREPKDARKAWDKAVKDGANPEDIIAGAERYRRECETTHRETSYIKHPATWLNKGCWMDEEPTLQLVSGGYRPYQDPHDPADYYEDL